MIGSSPNEKHLIYLCFLLIVCFFAKTEPVKEGGVRDPGTWPHHIRIGPVALVDTAGVFFLAVLIGHWRGWNSLFLFVGLMILTIPIHMIVGAPTALVQAVRGN